MKRIAIRPLLIPCDHVVKNGIAKEFQALIASSHTVAKIGSMRKCLNEIGLNSCELVKEVYLFVNVYFIGKSVSNRFLHRRKVEFVVNQSKGFKRAIGLKLWCF